jgi:mRNA-degrading endonuclease toxin of MazEF toxin-antitoxin module
MLSTTEKRGKYYHPFTIGDKTSVALLSQIRTMDSSRLGSGGKIGVISRQELEVIKHKVRNIL